MSSDKVVSAGKFGETPEISFNVTNRKKAESLGRRYNQVSIWDWGKQAKDMANGADWSDDWYISTNGTGKWKGWKN